MPDIFLSYNREDQAAARRFAEAFQQEGFEVWWDVTLRSGEAYDEVTEAALNEAKAVVVLWSPRSVISRWVRAEATQADRNKTLVPVTIEACKRPIMFELTQTADLCGWDGDARNGAWLAFLGDVKRFVQAGGPVSMPAPAAPPAAFRPPERLSICVLPFANMSGDPEQEYFADGISEDIITDLSKVSELLVIARNTAFTFKGKSIDIRQAARQLEVTHILEGSVRKAGSRVRVTAQLIDGASGGHLWADRWDRDLDDIFALQDEISQAIVKALRLKLLPEQKKAIEDRGTTNLDAYDKYLRGRALANGASTVDDLYRARDLCRQALAIDPGFALPRGALVQIYAFLESFAPASLEQLRREQDALTDEAIARAPDHWSSRLVDGRRLAVKNQWGASLTALETALAQAPASEVNVRFSVGVCLAQVGRMNDCLAMLESARAADPLSSAVSSYLQMVYYIEGRDDDSRAEYERTSDLPGSREIPEHTALFRAWDLGDEQGTRLQFRRFLTSRTLSAPVLEKVADVFDQPAAALALLRQAFLEDANQDATRMSFIGWYAGRFGDSELALAALRRSLIDFGFDAKFVIWWPFLKRARQTPGFRQLVRDLGVYDYWRASGNWGDFARPLGDDDFEIIR